MKVYNKVVSVIFILIGIFLCYFGVLFHVVEIELYLEQFDLLNMIIMFVCAFLILYTAIILMMLGKWYWKGYQVDRDFVTDLKYAIPRALFFSLVSTVVSLAIYKLYPDSSYGEDIVMIFNLLYPIVIVVFTLGQRIGIQQKNMSTKSIVQSMDGFTEEETFDNGRRFTLTVQEIFKDNQDGTAYVFGKVWGSVEKGDSVYIYEPGKVGVSTTVLSLENEKSEEIDRLEEEKGKIHLDYPANKLGGGDVISSIRPQKEFQLNIPLENPRFLGLLMDYLDLKDNQAFRNQFNYELCHAKFLVKFQYNSISENAWSGKGKASIGFYSVVNDQKESAFAVFTDWDAYRRWNFVGDEKAIGQALVMRFDEIMKVLNPKKDSMVINPFGPCNIVFPPEFLSMIVDLEGYKKEFGA